MTHELTVQLPHSNIKDKDEDIINSQHAREDGHKSLDELESLLLADTVWQDKIIEVLAKRENWIIDRYRLHGNIRDFFDEQRIGGNAQRDESDCRSHFYHWIIKHLNTPDMEQNGNPQLIETLMSRLCQPRTTKERFRLPFDEETAAKLLKCAIAGEVSRFGGTFLYPDAVDSQVRNLAASLTSGRRYGVMLCGLCGNGKTTVMRAFQNLLNVIRIPDNYHRTVYGMPIVNAVHIAHLCRNSYTEFLRLCDMEMLGIDDMGIEPVEVQEFGNMHRPLTDLLARRYENRGFSFITTNLVPQQIRKLYGDRIADRLNEMVDKIVFDNPSFRK